MQRADEKSQSGNIRKAFNEAILDDTEGVIFANDDNEPEQPERKNEKTKNPAETGKAQGRSRTRMMMKDEDDESDEEQYGINPEDECHDDDSDEKEIRSGTQVQPMQTYARQQQIFKISTTTDF